jgi:hypothetical protein
MTARTPSIRSMLFALCASALLAVPASAQDAPDKSLVPTTVAPMQVASTDSVGTPAGPAIATASVAVRRPVSEARSTAAAAGRASAPGTALMIVGGAAVLTGIVVGGDAGHAISIGGAVIGLIGLYQYLQ